MPERNYKECCEIVSSTADKFGIAAVNWRTIQRWYQDFRVNRLLSAPPIPDKHNLHPFLQHNHDIVIKIKQYAKENLHILSANLITQYLHDVIIPSMIQERGNPDNKSNEALQADLLAEYGLTKLSVGTVCRWMNAWF